jgi:hypothetical protein
MPNPPHRSSPELAIHFVLYHLRLDGEDEPIEVTVPWPANQTSLEDARAVLDDSPLLCVRLEGRNVAGRISSKGWTIIEAELVDQATTADLWPDDATVAGRDFRAWEPSSLPPKGQAAARPMRCGICGSATRCHAHQSRPSHRQTRDSAMTQCRIAYIAAILTTREGAR